MTVRLRLRVWRTRLHHTITGDRWAYWGNTELAGQPVTCELCKRPESRVYRQVEWWKDADSWLSKQWVSRVCDECFALDALAR